ncbi:surface protease GP63 [Trypanosoma cruzi]|nr:surface protease GP63 [Trypanosoma cruzi]
MHLRVQDALRVCSGVWKDRQVPIRIKKSKKDLCDIRKDCGFFWRCAVNSLDGAFGCKNGALTFAHENILTEETVPAAVNPHADRLLVRPLEGPLTVSSFATGSVCIRFTHPHMASRSTVRHVAGVRGRALSVVVHSATSAMPAGEHHDCDDIDGMELQDDDGSGRTLESHWWQRHARDERMALIGCAGCCRGSAPH